MDLFWSFVARWKPVKDQTIRYQALDDDFDFYSVVKWKTFDMQNEKHLRILKGSDDPISLEDLLEIGMSGEDQIVQLPCATKKMRCNFTRESIVKCFRAKPECPVCKTYYPIPGTQPSGTLRISTTKKYDCESYMGDGTITLEFSFPNGVQGMNHPHPGVPYGGGTRIAYLPNVDEGKEALELLVEAFKRGQVFTIGRGLTSGADNSLTFGSIHLKTNRSGGTSAHGWPDNSYFSRLKAECAAKMIFGRDLKKEIAGQQKGVSAKII